MQFASVVPRIRHDWLVVELDVLYGFNFEVIVRRNLKVWRCLSLSEGLKTNITGLNNDMSCWYVYAGCLGCTSVSNEEALFGAMEQFGSRFACFDGDMNERFDAERS